MQSLGSDQSQRALTAPQELNGGVTSAITIFHITGIVPKVFLLYGADGQGNCHLLLTKVLLEHSERSTKNRQNINWVIFLYSPKLCVWMETWGHADQMVSSLRVDELHGQHFMLYSWFFFYWAQKTYCRRSKNQYRLFLRVRCSGGTGEGGCSNAGNQKKIFL